MRWVGGGESGLFCGWLGGVWRVRTALGFCALLRYASALQPEYIPQISRCAIEWVDVAEANEAHRMKMSWIFVKTSCISPPFQQF